MKALFTSAQISHCCLFPPFSTLHQEPQSRLSCELRPASVARHGIRHQTWHGIRSTIGTILRLLCRLRFAALMRARSTYLVSSGITIIRTIIDIVVQLFIAKLADALALGSNQSLLFSLALGSWFLVRERKYHRIASHRIASRLINSTQLNLHNPTKRPPVLAARQICRRNFPERSARAFLSRLQECR